MDLTVCVNFVDQIMMVDGVWIEMELSPQDAERVIQWRPGERHIEYADGRPYLPLAGTDEEYLTHIKGYVQQFETRKAELEAAAEEARRQAEEDAAGQEDPGKNDDE